MDKCGGAWGGNTLVDPPDRENGVMSRGGSREDGEGWTGVRRGTVREKRNYTLDYQHHEPLYTHTAPEYLTWKQMEGELVKTKGFLTGLDPSFYYSILH